METILTSHPRKKPAFRLSDYDWTMGSTDLDVCKDLYGPGCIAMLDACKDALEVYRFINVCVCAALLNAYPHTQLRGHVHDQ